MDPIRLKLERQLERLLEGVDPADGDAVEAAIGRFRTAVDNFLQQNPEIAGDSRGERLLQAREEVIEERLSSLETRPDPPPPPPEHKMSAAPPGGFKRGFVTGLLVAFALVVVVGVAGVLSDTLDISTGEVAERKRLFENEFQDSIPHVQAMAEYAARVRGEIERRQAEDPESLEGVTDRRFVGIEDLDEELWEERPEGLPDRVRLVVRADQEAYKILVSGPLCRAALLTRPELVDPRRIRDGLDCTHFGYWNDAGEGL